MTGRTTARTVLALAVAASLAACGGDREPTSTASTAGGPTAPSSATPSTAQQPCESRAATAAPPAGTSVDLSQAPTVAPSDAPPPCTLQIGDVVVGTGPEAVDGSTVAVKYVGAFYGTGQQFDSSWSRGADQTLPVTLGQGQVIPGFEQAILGMRVGGRRVATVPSDLAYGARGQGPIPGGATLVFVLDLAQVG